MAGSRRPRTRLDQALVDRGLASNRTKAQALILAGRVWSQATRLDKPGTRVPADLPLAVRAGRSHVSRAGPKLEAALGRFALDVSGRDALDVGASTGGFTEALLRAGVRRVIALDVGHGLLDARIAGDPRVTVLDGVNARYLTPSLLPFRPTVASIDVSFISLGLVLPAVARCLDGDAGDVVALVKPQFEVGRGHVGRGGIVRDPALHRDVLVGLAGEMVSVGLAVCGIIASPILGAEGNREFLMHVRRGPGTASPDRHELAALVDRVVLAC
jgi:23S rRNA (cytidine1920-2'-O)/16S rRNA (cytidine1409-2'-O)-methyltransferase